MRRVALLAALLCAGLPLLAQAQTPRFSAEELAAKNTEARGGLAKLQALKSVRFTGTLKAGGGVELGFTELVKRPGMVRNEFDLQGLTIVQAYDGKEGWQINPLQGRKDPERMPADDVKDLIDNADLDGPLVDYKAKGNKLEYLGTEDVEGSEAHKLRVTERSGDKRIIYLDPDYFLAIRVVYQRQIRGREVEEEVDLGDYEKVAGLWWPFEIASGRKGATEKQQIVIDKAEPNLPLDDALFHFPAKQ